MSKTFSRRDFLKAATMTGAAATLAACAPAVTAVPTTAPVQATTAPTASMPYKGTQIKVLMINQDYFNYVTKALPEFEALTGIKVDLQQVAFAVALTQIETELSSGSSAYDLVTNIYVKAQRWMRAGWLSPIDDYISKDKFDIDDFLPALVDAHRYQNALYGVPFAAECTQMIYRKDVLDAAGLKAPTTFAELRTVLDKTNKPPDFYSYAMRTIPAGVHFPFPVWLQGYGGNIFKDPPNDVTPTLNTPEAVAAATDFCDLITKYSIGGTQVYDSPDCQNALAQGKAGIYIDALGLFGPIRDPTKSKLVDQFAVAMVPGGPKGVFPQIASHAMAIPKAAKNKGAAWEFVKWSLGKAMLTRGALDFTFSIQPRKSVLTSPDYAKKYSIAGVNVGDLITQALTIAKCAYRVEPEFSEVGARLGQSLDQIISSQMSVKDALDGAQKDAVAIMVKAGRKISQ